MINLGCTESWTNLLAEKHPIRTITWKYIPVMVTGFGNENNLTMNMPGIKDLCTVIASCLSMTHVHTNMDRERKKDRDRDRERGKEISFLFLSSKL